MKTTCKAKERGKPSIEFYDENNKPQYYCLGCYCASTEELLEVCTKCPDVVSGEQCEKDFEEYQKRIGIQK